jgi:hypothetical protein
MFVGPIPDGHEIDHVAARGCRHRDCIEPTHLEPVTRLENCRRVPRPTHCSSGHPMSGDNLVVQIRRRGYSERRCRTCKNEARRRQRAAQRAGKD